MVTISSFVTPDDCLLAIVIGAAEDLPEEGRYAALIGLAGEFQVPVVSIFVQHAEADRDVNEQPGALVLCSHYADPLGDESILQAVNGHNRRKLILAGKASEGSVTIMALSALARGFDVHVLEDVCQGSSDHVHAIAMNRLAQAGTVLMTALQLRMEWTAFDKRLQTASAAAR